MSSTGRLGPYYWAEVPTALAVGDVVRGLSAYLRGLVAGNIAWDSGVMQELSPVPPGWRVENGRVVSPTIDDTVLASWPQSTCNAGRFDEWYFWRPPVPALELHAFSKWIDTPLSEASELAFPGGFDLLAQLEVANPEVVIGEGHGMFAMSKTEGPVQRLLELCRAA